MWPLIARIRHAFSFQIHKCELDEDWVFKWQVTDGSIVTLDFGI
jgi:hypothetical protein